MQGLNLNSRDFTDTVQMDFAITDIRRYQQAYMGVNNVEGIMVKWKKGWYGIKHPMMGWSFYRPTSFRNMIDALEQRLREKSESALLKEGE